MPENLSGTVAPHGPVLQVAVPSEKALDSWARWLLPSISDVFFLVFFFILAFAPTSAGLLDDADTGWHIRTGEIIMATHSAPRTDSFSYTRADQPWFAWEWLCDLALGAIHHVAGLNGVVIFSAAIISATFALLFRFVLRRCGSFVVSASLTLLAFAAAQIHMLARPHILSWLFTLLWVDVLYRFQEGKRSSLLWLPLLMLLWVNVHGGFILGLVLLALFGCSHIWNYLCDPGNGKRQPILDLAIAFCACLTVTLITPYGYKLHIHVYQYLSNSFLMNSIDEFSSPNFHVAGYGYFEAFILLTVLAVLLARAKVISVDLLLLLFSIHAGLYAARNIPISAILMSMAMSPMLAAVISPSSGRLALPSGLRPLLETVQDISESMAAMEKQFRGHGLAIGVMVFSAATALNGGCFLSVQLIAAHFDEKKFPVHATEFIARRGIHDHLFNPDNWSGYLIYKLYPGTKVYFDDRHDFYGETFVKDYAKTMSADWQWRVPLDKAKINWILTTANSPLSGVVKESREWRAEYDDGIAIIFARVQ